ncbi:uncharacterized protein Z520_10989 [Fonsecaea multimorphosa CBS 102226]|uniref:Uncharacterized protein n=1 Tax=Fonsecaea multimorphosa CBS 102226 TaxID=1442371 RepID=A0A0D2I831_9EURO|nr:uncharacterized protein Z520_10989 [Fonsecaea multimorphosa CBS 102226]KIX93346.1 hypothetical protein Z520_10989 [Fonsecaea multimorphosa CBS 102226]
MCRETPDNDTVVDHLSDSGASDKESKKRSFFKIESSGDHPNNHKRLCLPPVLKTEVVSVMEMKRTFFHDHRPLCGISLRVAGDQNYVNLVMSGLPSLPPMCFSANAIISPIELINDEDTKIIVFTHADTTFADNRLLMEDGSTEAADGMPAKNVVFQGTYPNLYRREVVVVAGDCWYKVNLCKGDDVLCLNPKSSTPTLCFSNECEFPHSSYIRLTSDMLIPHIPQKMEAWNFPNPAHFNHTVPAIPLE